MTTPMYSMTWQKPEQLLRLTWLAGTQGMTDEDFQQTLEVLADSAIQHRAKRLVIDVRELKYHPPAEVLRWRDKVTVGKYNEAGVERQAWIWPGDVSNFKPSSKRMTYSERYFADEDAALAWLMLPN